MAVEVREVPDVVAWVVPMGMRAAGFFVGVPKALLSLLRAAVANNGPYVSG